MKIKKSFTLVADDMGCFRIDYKTFFNLNSDGIELSKRISKIKEKDRIRITFLEKKK